MKWKERYMIGRAWHYSATKEKTACGLQKYDFLYSTRILRKVNCYRCKKTKVYKEEINQ